MDTLMSSLECHCDTVLKKLFPEYKFVRIRPEWLKNMELDFYCSELKLAVQCHGMQHYHFPNSIHQNISEWFALLTQDDLKARLCSQVGIKLISIPSAVNTLALVESFIRYRVER